MTTDNDFKLDHSSFDIEAEIQKFLSNGGEIQQVAENKSKLKKYRRNGINIAYSEEQNSTE